MVNVKIHNSFCTLYTISCFCKLLRIIVRSITFSGEVHPPKLQWSNNLSLHVSLKVDKDCWEVSVGVVGYARCGDALEEFCGRELGSQHSQVLVDQRTERDTE